MMNCEQARHSIQDYLDGELNELRSTEMRAHLSACRVCDEELRKYELMTGLLRQYPVTQADEQQVRSMLDRFRQEVPSPDVERERNFRGAGLAVLAATVAFVFLLGGLWSQWNGTQFYRQGGENIVLTSGATETLAIALDAGRSMDEVTLRLELPENVELDGYPGQRSLQWKTSLNRGTNILPLPLKGLSAGSSELVLWLDSGSGPEQELRVDLESAPEGPDQT